MVLPDPAVAEPDRTNQALGRLLTKNRPKANTNAEAGSGTAAPVPPVGAVPWWKLFDQAT